jgi:hypothetical protein
MRSYRNLELLGELLQDQIALLAHQVAASGGLHADPLHQTKNTRSSRLTRYLNQTPVTLTCACGSRQRPSMSVWRKESDTADLLLPVKRRADHRNLVVLLVLSGAL